MNIFEEAFPYVVSPLAIIALFIVLAVTSTIPPLWLVAWWLTGCLCAIALTYFKGENFGGGIKYILGIGFMGCLGFFLIPFGIGAVFCIVAILSDKKAFDAMEERDGRISKWARAGYPKSPEYKDFWEAKP